MDRDRSPRVVYWTTSFEPEIEAVASEVALLRRAFAGSVAWGISARDKGAWSRERGFAVSPRWALPFRYISRIAQRSYELNHVFGGPGDWHHLRALGPHPSVMTFAVQPTNLDAHLLYKLDRIVVEWPAARLELEALGIPPDRVELVYPPVDVQRFVATPAPNEPFTVLFASSPDRKEMLEARGVDLLLDVAAQRPSFRFRLAWRPWGDSAGEVQREIERRKLENVQLIAGRFRDMQVFYRASHATVAPFRYATYCKSAPNSIIESLACGRPVVVTRTVGLADLVERSGAGHVTLANPDDLAAQLDKLEANWNAYSVRARRLAEEQFNETRFIEAYRRIYRELLSSSH